MPTPCPWRAYARVHAFYQLCRFTSPPEPTLFIALQAPFVLAALMRPSKATLIGSAVTNWCTIAWHLPAVVDMDWWAMNTDAAVILALLLVSGDTAFISHVIRIQMAIFYAASGLWKANVDHSDPRLSCSSLMLVQILCGWLPEPLLATSLVSLVATTAPHITLIVECGIPILLLSPSRTAWRLGVALALALHLGIMAAPLPLSIADFGALSASRLFWITPHASVRAVAEVEAALSLHGGEASRGVALGAALVVGVTATMCAVHGSCERVVANLAYSALAALTLRTLVLDDDAPPPTSDKARAAPPVLPALPALPPRARRTLAWALIGCAAFYAFGMPMLGLIDVGGCTMFSHIKQHGGSSHAFLPTGLIQRWLAHRSPADGALGPLRDLAGGVVRVERSTSRFLNAIYPGETLEFEPEPLVRRTLHSVGHEARLFTHQGARARNLRGKNMGVGGGLTGLGIGYIMVQRSNGAHGRPFTRYTLPTLEVRMMIEAMRERNESFELEYTRIAGAPPLDDHAAAEEWRASGCGTRVHLREADGVRDCSAVDTCAAGDWFVRWRARRACAEDELAVLATPPGWLARKLLLANPYPILQPAGRYCGSSG